MADPELFEEVQCDFCGRDDTRELFVKEGFTLVTCNRCGLIYVNPRFKTPILNRRYSEKYFLEEYLPAFMKMKNERYREFWEMLQKFKACKKTNKLFDVGCGPGFFVNAASRGGWEASGCETASFAVDYGRKELNVNILPGDFLELELPEKAYDVITFWDVLEHLPFPVKALEKVTAMLRPGGMLALSTPNLKGRSFLSCGKGWEYIGPSEHIYYFTPETITRILKSMAMAVVTIDAVDDNMLVIARQEQEKERSKFSSASNGKPAVSVIVVNFDGKELLQDCFLSLQQMSYPREKTELILVDNGSSDGSVELMQEHFPEAKLLINEENLGFAVPNNQAAESASGELLFFLNNDMRVAPDCLSRLVELMASDPGISAACPKILDWSGDRIDFAGAGINFEGKGFQQGYGSQDIYSSCEEKDLIFGNGGAFCIYRKIFLELDGFEPLNFAYYEDVDLGWRMALEGHRIKFAPLSLVYHKHNTTARRFPPETKKFHMERNALFSVLKNYSDDSLPDILAVSLLLGVCRTLYAAGMDPYADRKDPGPDDLPDLIRRLQPAVPATYPAAVADAVANIESIAGKRKTIQSRRKHGDPEVLSRFVEETTPSPSDLQEQYNAKQENLMNDFGIKRRFRRGRGGRILMLTHEAFGRNLSGPAIRCMELARVLNDEFDVEISSPYPPEIQPLFCTFHRHTPRVESSLREMVRRADILIVQGHKSEEFPFLNQCATPIVVDLFCPFSLENLDNRGFVSGPLRLRERSWNRDLGVLAEQLAMGDFFMCASEMQRDFWLGNLHAAKRISPLTYAEDPTLRHLIDVVPFGIPSTPPSKTRQVVKGVREGIGEKDFLLLWGGSILNWQDPLTLIRAMEIISRQRDDVKLFFMGTKHPNPLVPEMKIVEKSTDLAEELGVKDRLVFFNTWVPYEERSDYLLEVDLGICTHRPTLETRFSFRTRLLDCLWASLPIVTTEGDFFANLVSKEGLGATVPAGDPDALAGKILSLLDDPDTLEGCRRNISRIQGEFTWGKAVTPLLRFCRAPWKRSDGEKEKKWISRMLGTGLGRVEVKFHLSEKTREKIKKSFAGRWFLKARDWYRQQFSQVRTISDVRGKLIQGQTFRARENYLYRIDIQLATYSLTGNFPLIFHLREGVKARDDLATVILDTAAITPNAFNAFSFDPIPDSKGKAFYFFLECPEAGAGNAPSVWIQPGEPDHRGGYRMRDGKKRRGGLIFEDFYKIV